MTTEEQQKVYAQVFWPWTIEKSGGSKKALRSENQAAVDDPRGVHRWNDNHKPRPGVAL